MNWLPIDLNSDIAAIMLIRSLANNGGNGLPNIYGCLCILK
jgi:hypothetical protein